MLNGVGRFGSICVSFSTVYVTCKSEQEVFNTIFAPIFFSMSLKSAMV